MTATTETLMSRWEDLRRQKPGMRIRDAAQALGVSEAELVAAQCGGTAVRLEGDWTQLIRDLPMLGRVMCLTRNEHTVHERFGEFLQIDFFHGMGQVVGPDIDLRLFMSRWKHGFAVTTVTPEGERQSLQFFDAGGTAILKVHLQRESNYGAYGVILNKYRAADPSAPLSIEKAGPRPPEIPDAEIDVQGLREAWLGLKDTHAFFPMIHKYRVSRVQALRLAPGGFAARVAKTATRRMLEAAAGCGLPIMVFIGNPGCLQIHTGPVKNIRMFGSEWLNVLDEDFNMHLREAAVSSVWVVRKPTLDGVVTSLEVYDEGDNNLAMFFGRRKPGEEEDPAWRNLAESLKEEAL